MMWLRHFIHEFIDAGKIEVNFGARLAASKCERPANFRSCQTASNYRYEALSNATTCSDVFLTSPVMRHLPDFKDHFFWKLRGEGTPSGKVLPVGGVSPAIDVGGAKARRAVATMANEPAWRDRANLYLVSNTMNGLSATFKLNAAVSQTASAEPHQTRSVQRTIYLHAVVEQVLFDVCSVGHDRRV
jgi:hypothetical protein